MKDSVNWYFQSLDQKTGMKDLKKYVQYIGYGNADLSGGLSRSWMESSLKISPVEQVELLTKLYTNEFHFQDKNIQTVKDTLLLSENEMGALYGKTGTGNLEHNNVNGWFVGFVEKDDNTYFFAANIQAKEQADGPAARRIALEILKAKELYSID
jgi:bla regulator protein BlaR1